MSIPDEIADAVREKQQQDQVETAKLISKGTPVARLNTGIDGGMNQVFAAKLPDGSTGLSEGGEGQGLSLAALSRAPGTIPAHVNPPRGSGDLRRKSRWRPRWRRRRRRAAATRVASAAPTRQIRRLLLQPRPQGRHRRRGHHRDARQPASGQAEGHRGQAATSRRAPPRPRSRGAEAAPTPKQAAAKPPLKPSLSDDRAAPRRRDDGLVAGSQPIVPANSFDSRFSAVK